MNEKVTALTALFSLDAVLCNEQAGMWLFLWQSLKQRLSVAYTFYTSVTGKKKGFLYFQARIFLQFENSLNHCFTQEAFVWLFSSVNVKTLYWSYINRDLKKAKFQFFAHYFFSTLLVSNIFFYYYNIYFFKFFNTLGMLLFFFPFQHSANSDFSGISGSDCHPCLKSRLLVLTAQQRSR